MAVTFIGFSSPAVGNTQTIFDIELVKKDLLNHFNTKKGERVMDSTYGCIAWDLIFTLDNPNNISVLDADIRRIIYEEPRVQLLDLTINNVQGGYEAYLELRYVVLDSVEQLYVKFLRTTTEENDDTIQV